MAPKAKVVRKPKVRAPDYAPRPPNAWILYRSAQLKLLKLDVAVANKPQAEISKLIGFMWRDETPATRKKFEAQAAVAKAEHSKLYPNYTFNPQRKSKPAPPAHAPTPTPTADPAEAHVHPHAPASPSSRPSTANVNESSLFSHAQSFYQDPPIRFDRVLGSSSPVAEADAPWPSPAASNFGIAHPLDGYESPYVHMPLSAPACTSTFSFDLDPVAPQLLSQQPGTHCYYYAQPQPSHYELYTPPYDASFELDLYEPTTHVAPVDGYAMTWSRATEYSQHLPAFAGEYHNFAH